MRQFLLTSSLLRVLLGVYSTSLAIPMNPALGNSDLTQRDAADLTSSLVNREVAREELAENGHPILKRGMSAAESRLLILVTRQNDLELQMQFVNQSRTQLANTSAQLLEQKAQLSGQPGREGDVSQIDAQLASIESVDQKLATDAQGIQVQLTAVKNEIEATNKILHENIEHTFKIFD